MDTSKEPMHAVQFSMKPLVNVHSWEQLPYLEKDRALFFIGSSGLFLLFVIALEFLPMDPFAQRYWLYHTDNYYFLAVFITTIVTLFIAMKQYYYYYETKRPGKKNGLFQGHIKQVNSVEMDVDDALAFTGSMLFTFALMPVFWFALLSFYSMLVSCRCYLVLYRPKYFEKHKAEFTLETIQWYGDAIKRIDMYHGDLHIRAIIVGWLLSNIFLSIISIVNFFILFYIVPSLSLIEVLEIHTGLLIITFISWFSLSKKSYEFGIKINKKKIPQIKK